MLPEIRLWSSSATFQKGLYHLFLLKRDIDVDAYAGVLRTYQALFFLVATGYLLSNTEIPKPKDHGPAPDPAADLGHRHLRNWGGFPCDHPVAKVSKESVGLLKRVWHARSNLLYRPYMLLQDDRPTRGFFEDCTLQRLIVGIPTAPEIENTYVQLLKAIGEWSQMRDERANRLQDLQDGRANRFLDLLRATYSDLSGRFPRSTLLTRYALILGEARGVAPGFEDYVDEWDHRILSTFGHSETGG